MEYNLTLEERFAILGFLPKEGDYITMKHLRLLKEKLVIQASEAKEVDAKREGDNLTWNQEKDVGKDIEFTEFQSDIIVKELQELDKKRKLADSHISVWDKFVGNKNKGGDIK